jgi:hypothetical protein
MREDFMTFSRQGTTMAAVSGRCSSGRRQTSLRHFDGGAPGARRTGKKGVPPASMRRLTGEHLKKIGR